VCIPTSQELITSNEITENNVRKCFERSLKNIDKNFLQSRPADSRVTVARMMKNLVATAVSYWIDWRLGTRFKSKEELHCAICNLDQLTKLDAWIASADPLAGVNRSKTRKKMKNKVAPTEMMLVLSDDEVEVVSLVEDDKDD